MKNRKIIQKTINCIDSILKYTKDVDYAEFRNNSMMAEACVFNLRQIGELVNKLDKEYLSKHNEVPWFAWTKKSYSSWLWRCEFKTNMGNHWYRYKNIKGTVVEAN